MAEDRTTLTPNPQPSGKDAELQEGYAPLRKGWQPEESNLNVNDPPQGGSGVPAKDSRGEGDAPKE